MIGVREHMSYLLQVVEIFSIVGMLVWQAEHRQSNLI